MEIERKKHHTKKHKAQYKTPQSPTPYPSPAGWGFVFFLYKIVRFFFIFRNIYTIFAPYNHKTQTKLRIYV